MFILYFTLGLYYWRDINNQSEKYGSLTTEVDVKKGNFKGTYFFYEYRTTHFFYYSYPLYFIMRRILFASLIVFWEHDGFFQLCFLSLLSVISLVWFASYAPFTSRLRNF
jgi:hypothetical protein